MTKTTYNHLARSQFRPLRITAWRRDYPEHRDPVLVKNLISDDRPLQSAVAYTNQHGMEVAVVYLHDLCEIE